MSCKERGQPRTTVSRSSTAATRLTAVCALALLSSACTDSAPEARAAAAPAAIPVITQEARIEPMGIEIEAVGTTQANESVEVTSKASSTEATPSRLLAKQSASSAVIVRPVTGRAWSSASKP